MSMIHSCFHASVNPQRFLGDADTNFLPTWYNDEIPNMLDAHKTNCGSVPQYGNLNYGFVSSNFDFFFIIVYRYHERFLSNVVK